MIKRVRVDLRDGFIEFSGVFWSCLVNLRSCTDQPADSCGVYTTKPHRVEFPEDVLIDKKNRLLVNQPVPLYWKHYVASVPFVTNV